MIDQPYHVSDQEDVYVQVAVAVPCDYKTADGKLDGQHVALVMGEPKPGEIALYRRAAPEHAGPIFEDSVEWVPQSHVKAIVRALDREGVPRADATGAVFSLWGRIQEYAHQEVQAVIAPAENPDDEVDLSDDPLL